jgi:predicted TIM-barrel fold metal-dependent hydrolase
MNRLLSIISCSLLPVCTLVHSPASMPVDVAEIWKHLPEESYYTLEDFSRVKKFDLHIHLNTLEPTFIKLAQKDNFRFLDIVDDRPFGIPMAAQQEIAIKDLKTFPEQMAVATTFSVAGFNDAGWAEKTIEGLKRSFADGAKAVKIWKNIGMSLKDKDGKFVMVDDPRLDPILDFLEKNHIPLVGHNGEPRDCWLPLDKMTFSQDYYGSHPEYHMYLHKDYPSYMDQINARDNMLKKHPKLQFIGAHLGSLEWSLDELSKRLDKYPNMRVDLSRMSNLQLHALRDWKKTRDFFIKYQDRLVYGTDQAINAAADPAKLEQRVQENWLEDWKFFATDEKLSLERFGELKGLKLPKQVIDKIYYNNALNWLSGAVITDL